MTKSELVNMMAAASGVTKVAAEKALHGCLASIRGSLKRGEAVTLVGFGTFKVSRRKARKGRNPRTGQPVKVGQKRAPFFRTGKELRERLNGGTHG